MYFDFPLIDPALLNSAFDIFAITEAVKAAQRFMAAPAWDGFQLGQYGDFAGVTSDAAIEQYARNSAATVFHPTGTAYMSPYNAPHGVTNPDLTVKGTKGLRVVDASIFVSDGSYYRIISLIVLPSLIFRRCILRASYTSSPRGRRN